VLRLQWICIADCIPIRPTWAKLRVIAALAEGEGSEKLTMAAGRVPNVLDSCQISADILSNSEHTFSRFSSKVWTASVWHVYDTRCTLSETIRFERITFCPSYVCLNRTLRHTEMASLRLSGRWCVSLANMNITNRAVCFRLHDEHFKRKTYETESFSECIIETFPGQKPCSMRKKKKVNPRRITSLRQEARKIFLRRWIMLLHRNVHENEGALRKSPSGAC